MKLIDLCECHQNGEYETIQEQGFGDVDDFCDYLAGQYQLLHEQASKVVMTASLEANPDNLLELEILKRMLSQ